VEVFISWSGERSKCVAEALRNWIPKIINAVLPWLSSADIDKAHDGVLTSPQSWNPQR
jgi:hypothetical protein